MRRRSGHAVVRETRGGDWRRRSVLLWLLGLSGCGFQPLYGDRAHGGLGSVEELTQIGVDHVPDRIGQILRNNLVDRLTPTGEPDRPRWRLAVRLAVAKQGLLISKDESITRFNLNIIANFVLYETGSNREVTRGQSRTFASYNVVTSQFATLIAEKDAETRAVREISDDIRTRLAVFFTRERAGADPAQAAPERVNLLPTKGVEAFPGRKDRETL